jgi:hypothetical protein
MQAKCAQYLGATFKEFLRVIGQLVIFFFIKKKIFKKKFEIFLNFFLEIYFLKKKIT